MARRKKLPKAAPVSNPVAALPVLETPYVPQTPISDLRKQEMYQESCAYWLSQSVYYGYDGDKPLNVVKRLQAILGAPDEEKAQEALRKARGAIEMSLLAAWGSKRIPGPNLPETWEKKAKQQENLAKMLEKKGQPDQADERLRQAEEFRARAAKLKGT